MKLCKLRRSDFEASGSGFRYASLRRPRDAGYERFLRDSMRELGVLSPLLVAEKADGSLHLVDGLERYNASIDLNIDDLPCALISGFSAKQVSGALLACHYGRIIETTAGRIRFVAFVSGLGVADETIIKEFLQVIGFEPHQRILHSIRRIHALGPEILDFCHEKKYSMGQCLHLTRHPGELLTGIFALREMLQLTASTFDEILGELGDYLKFSGMPLSSFLEDETVRGLFETPEMNPPQRTRIFRSMLKGRRYPILTEVNGRLDRIRSGMNLPPCVTLNWDPILERDELDLTIKVKREDDLRVALETLGKGEVSNGVRDMLCEI
ncbi:MAG: ParB N-terminal domain-containing protein [Oligoflexales bacterium]|nr:ParB N-terminal domain-containing protein [Oligoflexales bacterium]